MATDKIQINLRVPDDFREKLQAAAAERGVSVNKEITDRLQKTFDEDVRMSLDGQTADLFAILRVVATAMELTGPTAGFMSTPTADATKTWLGNPFAYDQAFQAAVAVLEAFRPTERMPANPLTADMAKLLGVGFANSALEEGASGQTRTPGNPAAVARAKRLNADLGPLADRIQKFNDLTKKRGKRK